MARRHPARSSGEKGSRRSLGTSGDEAAECASGGWGEAMPERHDYHAVRCQHRQHRPQRARGTVRAVMLCGRTIRLFRLVAACHHRICPRHRVHRSRLREHAAQHRRRRNCLQRQGQHQQNQQKSVEVCAHAASVARKGEQPKRQRQSSRVPYEDVQRRLRGS